MEEHKFVHIEILEFEPDHHARLIKSVLADVYYPDLKVSNKLRFTREEMITHHLHHEPFHWHGLPLHLVELAGQTYLRLDTPDEPSDFLD